MRDEGRKKRDRGKRPERRLEREGTRYRRGEMLNKKGFRGTEIRHNKRLYYFYVIIQNFLFLGRNADFARSSSEMVSAIIFISDTFSTSKKYGILSVLRMLNI